MTDIVERLRNLPTPDRLEAATEIEKLRAITKPMTIKEATALAYILPWVWRKERIQWLDANGKLHVGEVFELSNAQGEVELRRDLDVRDFYLHIKRSGVSHFILMDEVITKVNNGEMVRS